MVDAISPVGNQNKKKEISTSRTNSSDILKYLPPKQQIQQDTYVRRRKEKPDIWKILGVGGIIAGAVGLFSIASTIGMFRRRPAQAEEILSPVQTVYEDLTKNLGIKDMALPKGLQTALEEVKSKISNLKGLTDRGGKGTQAVLLYGPPGTGKTTFVRALAKDTNANLAILDTTKMTSKYMGETEQNIQALVETICKDAQENPSKKFIVFVDEIDSIMMVDNSLSAKHSNTTLNEFKRCLTERLFKHDNIITIGATNLSPPSINGELNWAATAGKQLDSAMLDRFSTQILVGLPSKEQLAEAIAKHYKGCAQVDDVLKNKDKLTALATELDGKVSFRNLNAIYDKASNLALQDKQPVGIKHFVQALESQKEAISNNATKANSASGKPFVWNSWFNNLVNMSK